VEALECDQSGSRGALQRPLDTTHPAQGPDDAQRALRGAPADRRTAAGGCEQLADVVVGHEALGVRTGQYDRPDPVFVRPFDERRQTGHDPSVHQAVRWIVQRRHQHAPPLLHPYLSHRADTSRRRLERLSERRA
jgi:hypothetical protein